MKTPFPNRYADSFNPNFDQLAGDPDAENAARQRAAGWKTVGKFLPMVGGLVGAGLGAAAGDPVMGYGVGQAAGSALGAGADMYGDSFEDEERKKALHRQALYDAIASLRR